MRIIFAGTPNAAVPTLQALIASPHDVALVITRPPARVGRGRSLQPSPVAAIAHEAGIPLVETSSLKSDEVAEIIEGINADAGVVVAYGGLVPPRILAMPRHGWMNLHFSDLPRWRGAAPIQWAIREGETTTASCVFALEEGLDTGDVYSRVTRSIERESAGELLEKMAADGGEHILKVLADIEAGNASATPQSTSGVTYARRLESVDGYVSFTRSADEEDRIIRSVTPNPGAYTLLPGGVRMKLGVATPVDDMSLAPGELRVTKRSVLVGCAMGALELGKVAPAGKSWMDAPAWARGARLAGDVRLGGEVA